MAAFAHAKSTKQAMEGADRVAAILLTMGKSLSARLMKHFDPDEIKQITRSAADLRPVPAQQLGTLIEEFATQFAIGASLVSSQAEVESMLDGVLTSEQIAEIMGDAGVDPDSSIWERISGVNESALASHLLNEHPQTAALILSKIQPAAAAKVIGLLPTDRRDGIIRRMLTVRPVIDEIRRLLERTLHQEFTANFQQNSGGEGQARMAEIINKLDRDQIEAVLNGLASTRPKAAEALKSQLFTFDDLVKLSERARGTLFNAVPTEKVVMALKGTEPDFREVILSALSSRVRKMIEQELNNGQPVPHRDVSDARRFITDMALDMASRNEIEIANDEEQDLVS